jgi:hypothetical protein
MDLVVSETNKGKKALLYEGFTYRIYFELKSEDISWRCTKRGCKAKLRMEMVISGKLDHIHEADERKLERKQVRLSMKRKANSDVSERPSKIICSELQKVEENNLTENDLKSLSMAIYRERRKRHPTLPKSREDVHTALDGMTIETSKSENMCLINDQESGMIIFSCTSNLRVLCTQVLYTELLNVAPSFFLAVIYISRIL